MAGSLSGWFTNSPLLAALAAAAELLALRFGSVPSLLISLMEFRKRSFSRSKIFLFVVSSKTPDIKLSGDAFSSSLLVRYAIATSNSLGDTTGVYSRRFPTVFLTLVESATAIPLSISKSIRSSTPFFLASRYAYATSNRLCPATPVFTDLATFGSSRISNKRL